MLTLVLLVLAQPIGAGTGKMGYSPGDARDGIFGALKTVEETPVTAYTFQYGINTDLVSTSVDGGTVTQSGNFAVVSSGTGAASFAVMQARDRIRYVPGQGMRIRFTGVFSCASGNAQEIGIGDATDGFFFGCNGSTFGVIYRQSGVDYFTVLNATNFSRVSLDSTLGNVYSIAYQWLGFGVVRWYVERPSGEMTLVHQLAYPNTSTVTSTSTPILGAYVRSRNTGGTTAKAVKVPSIGIAREGPPATYAVPNSFTARKATSGTFTNMVTLQNKSTFLGVENRVRLHLHSYSVSATGNADVACKFIRNTTLGGSPSYTDTNTSTSVSAVDVSGTTVSGGRLAYSVSFSASNDTSQNFPNGGLYVEPNETMTVACDASTGTPIIGVALNWHEEF